MAVQAAPAATANNANQNGAQLVGSFAPLPPVLVTNVQAAPLPTAVLRPATVGYPIG